MALAHMTGLLCQATKDGNEKTSMVPKQKALKKTVPMKRTASEQANASKKRRHYARTVHCWRFSAL